MISQIRNALSIAVAAGILIANGAIAAQQPRDSAIRRADSLTDQVCWRGRPLARCHAFLLFEFSAPRHLAGTKLDPEVTQPGNGYARWDHGLASQFSYDIGVMVNVRDRDAIGGTLTAGITVDGPDRPLVLGVNARYRRWLTNVVSADAAVGVLRMPVGVTVQRPFGLERQSVQRPALSLDARLGLGDLVAVTGRAMVVSDGRGRTHHALFAGASVGSTVTAALTGAYATFIGGCIMVGPCRGHGD